MNSNKYAHSTLFSKSTELGYFKLFAIIYTALIVSLAISFVYIEKKKTVDDIDNKLVFGSKVIIQILPKDFIEKGTQVPELKHSDFLAMTESMSLTTERLGFAYLYTLVKHPQTGKFQFSSMTLSPEEWKKDKDRYHYLYEYTDAPSEALNRALETMEPQYHEYKDPWGHFRSVFVPHKAPSGQIFIAAADYDISQLSSIMAKRIFYISTICLFLISGMIPLLIYVRKNHQRNEQELEARVKERTEQLLHANRLSELGRLAASVIHEIKNPLSIIMGYSSSNENESIEDISKIHNAAKRINFVLNGLRSFSRGEKDISKTIFDTHANLEMVVALWGPLLKKESGIEIRMSFRATHKKLLGVPQQFDQVVLNVITNARDAILEVRAQNEGVISLTTVNTSENQFVLIIEDNGKGMSAEVQNKISTAFYTTKDKEKGTGLGLYISKAIISDMEGQLQFDSKENQGTKVIITFPCSV